MHLFKGRCLCGMSQFSVSLNHLMYMPVTVRNARSGQAALPCILRRRASRLVEQDSIAPSHFASSARGERWFCPGCGCPLWFKLTATARYFIPWTLLEMSEDERRRLVLAAEIYTETQPALFWPDRAIRTL